MQNLLARFWSWYEKHYLIALTFTTLLFFLQIFHLYWLFTDVILAKLTGQSFFVFPSFWGVVSTFLDYTEIPALISTSIIYVNLLRKQFNAKNVWFLIFLNIQWLHLFWITDQVVVEHFGRTNFFHWSILVAWIAIIIDYAETPVIIDTLNKTYQEWERYFKKQSANLTD